MIGPKKLEFIFGDVTMTLTPADLEAIEKDYERETGKKATRMSPSEFADRCMARMKANARPTRTVLHN